MQSFIDVLVPAASALVGTWYDTTQTAMHEMPPHITLLWPWLPAPVPVDAIDQVRVAVGDVDPSLLTLRRVGRFPGVVHLAPEPRRPVDDLIARLAVAFPHFPTYGGRFGPAPIPHLTVATNVNELGLDTVERELRTAAAERPLTVVVDRVSISEERPGPDAMWAVRAEVAFRS